MEKTGSVILLSGGMDSAYAATWACVSSSEMRPRAFLCVNYGQKGAHEELKAARNVVSYLHDQFGATTNLETAMVTYPVVESSLLRFTLDEQAPGLQDSHGHPRTFVPGRNLIMIGLAAALTYEIPCKFIVGGWVSPDVDYPDCRPGFLQMAQDTASMALYERVGAIAIKAPVLYRTKAEVVSNGVAIGVPFHLTRSCYSTQAIPCNSCDSCLKRIDAFIEAGVPDPLYTPARWEAISEQRAKVHERDQG